MGRILQPLVVLSLLVWTIHGFQSLTHRNRLLSSTRCVRTRVHDDRTHEVERPTISLRSRLLKLRRHLSQRFKPFGLAVLTAAAIRSNQYMANAATPMPISIDVEIDSRDEGIINRIESEVRAEKAKLVEAFKRKAAKIGQEQGEAARQKFITEYNLQQDRLAKEKAQAMEKLKYTLLDDGICPFVDLEGKRRMFLLKTGRDLAKTPGTLQYSEALMLTKKGGFERFDKTKNREVLKLIVQDLKNRDIDTIQYFSQNRDQTEKILQMKSPKLDLLLETYQVNMEKYGQIIPPSPGTLSFKEKQEQDPNFQKKRKDEAKAKAAAKAKEVKAMEAAQKAKVKEEAKAKREQEKREKIAAKEAAKQAKREAKERTQMEKSAAKAAAVAAAKADNDSVASAEVDVDSDQMSPEEEMAIEEQVGVAPAPSPKGALRVIPVSAFVIAVAGGGYGVKMMREKAARDEEERQRQFKLIMGTGTPSGSTPGEDTQSTSTPSQDEVDSLMEQSDVGEAEVSEPPEAESPTQPPLSEIVESDPEALVETDAQPSEELKKRRMGIKSLFSRKSASARETNLDALIGPSASAPELARTMAKVFTYGAPGRFPIVESLAGGLPMQTFNLDTAKNLLGEAREAASYSPEEYAELFASVMNCMLVDIVDLASSSLKEDDKVTFEAINVVVDFMNHASLLYDETSMGVQIAPVTYGGRLAKSKLEQMYSTYAISGMMQMADNMDNRIGLLRFVFNINEKKAEGLLMQATTKTMMRMLKTEEGQKEMQGMMESMMGGAGMEDMMGLMGGAGGEEGPDIAQLTEMLTTLKAMKDSGSIPPGELDTIRSQFKESFGSSIDDLMAQAKAEEGALSSDEQRLLDLMQEILA